VAGCDPALQPTQHSPVRQCVLHRHTQIVTTATNVIRRPLGRILRPLLRLAVRRPGSLYQPILITSVQDGESLATDLHALAGSEGVVVFTTFGPDVGNSGPAVLFLHVSQAEGAWALQAEGALEQVQVVLWCEGTVDGVDPSLQDWLAQGIVFDPAKYASSPEEGVVGPTLLQCARDRQRRYNPVVLTASPATCSLVAQEALLRLQIAGFVSPVLMGPRMDPDPTRLRHNGAVVVRFGTGDPAELAHVRSQVAGFVEQRIQTLLVVDQDCYATLVRDPAWASLLNKGVSLPGTRYPERPARPALGPAAGEWPQIADVLVGAPPTVEPPRRLFQGDLSGVPLGDLLQTLSGGGQSGRLIVYGTRRLGVISIENGRVAHVSRLGCSDTAASLAARRGVAADLTTVRAIARLLLEERVYEMAGWQPANFVFIAGSGEEVPGSERLALDVTSLTLEVARRQDEAGRRELKVGGLGRIWSRSADGPQSVDPASPIALLWSRLDGETPLHEAARRAGLVAEEALAAVHALATAGRIRRAGESEGPQAEQPVQQVLRPLLSLGLRQEARDLVLAIKGRERLSAEGATLIAHLEAVSDASSSYAHFHAAAKALAGATTASPAVTRLRAEARLNAALMGVRSAQLPAAAAWAMLQAELDGGLARHTESRHLAIIAEVAARAGQGGVAKQALDRLRSMPGQEAERLHDTLSRCIAR
jgi:hypothetical protein